MLAGISADPVDKGITRVSWTEEYARGTDFMKQRMQKAGLEVWEDTAGNICGCLKGEAPKGSILSGSHLDTVFFGGAYDGAMGVVCALEAARLLRENGIRLRNHYKVLAMVEEEGTRTGNVLTGSTYLRESVEKTLEEADFRLRNLSDKSGEKLGKVISCYQKMEKIKSPMRSILEREPMVFIEVHAEQGPVLERENKKIGIVENIRGIINFEVTLSGDSGHPGTVPMSMRKDPSLAVYEICLRASHYVKEHYNEDATITFGRLEVRPGSGNSIPGEVMFSVDIRFRCPEVGAAVEQKVMELVRDQERKMGYQAERKLYVHKPPVPMDASVSRLLEHVCGRQKKTWMRMDSGAGHDAMNFAGICPTAMIFAPCRDGISHNVKELVSEENMQNAVDVLYETIIRLDGGMGK